MRLLHSGSAASLTCCIRNKKTTAELASAKKHCIFAPALSIYMLKGGVAERLIAAVLKTAERDERSGGSNPSSSAKAFEAEPPRVRLFYWRPSAPSPNTILISRRIIEKILFFVCKKQKSHLYLHHAKACSLSQLYLTHFQYRFCNLCFGRLSEESDVDIAHWSFRHFEISVRHSR